MDYRKKHSKKRELILELIRSTTTHPAAAWVYERAKELVPDLSLATVYRNIREFCSEGRVVSVGVVDGEERFDGRTLSHPHLVCERCGQISDADMDDNAFAAMDAHLRSGLEGAAAPGADSPGFSVNFRKTVFYGICDHCKKTA
jgi:Fur family peroxide stress response transcriptional regulator